MRWYMALFLPIALHSGFAIVPDPSHPAPHPKQGIVELLMEYLEVRYPSAPIKGDLLYVSVHRQALFHVRHGVLLKEYPIATAKNGLGSRKDSYRTPTGLHRITAKIGDGVPLYGIFKDRKFTGAIADTASGSEMDVITTRILWLDGLEQGHNRGGDQDSRRRYIYIHGTADEASIGKPSSMGCIRMRNHDVLELFDLVAVGVPVVILDN